MPSGCTILAVALGDRGHGTASMCRIECRGARAVGSACGGSQSAAQTHRAGADCPGLGRSAPGAAGGAKYRRQPADGVAMVTALCRERDRRPAARQDPQARQGADRGGNRGAGRGAGLHRAGARSNSLDRPGDGQSHRHLAGFGAAHLAGAQTAAAPVTHLQGLARSQLCRQAHRCRRALCCISSNLI